MAVASVPSRRTNILVLLLILLIGAAFRLVDLNAIPPGVFYDEGANGVDALRVLSGWHPVFFPGNQGREPLFIYFQAATMALIGPSPLALRLPAAFIGVLTIAAVYATFRLMGGQLVGTLGAAFVAISFWQVSLSRLAFRTGAMPLLLTLGVFWLFKAQKSGRYLHWAASGAFLGLAMYTYIPVRLAPALLGAWIVLTLVLPGWRRISAWRAIAGAAVMALAFLVVFSPLGYHFVIHPDDFFGRIEAAAKPATVSRSLLAGYARAIEGLFWIGDPNPRQDLPGRPLIEISTTLAGILGGIVVLRKRERVGLFCLVWTLAMTVPAALGDEPAHALRLAAVLPFIFYLPARGIAALSRAWRPLGAWLAAGIIVLTGLSTARDYFLVWANRPDVSHSFQAELLDSLTLVDRLPPHQTIFATTDVYDGQAIPLAFVPRAEAAVRAFDGQNTFVVPAKPTGPLYYVYARGFEPAPGVPFVDRMHLLATSDDLNGNVDGWLYQTSQPVALPPPGHEVSARIGPAVKVLGADVPTVARPGQTTRVALYWIVDGELPPGQWEFLAHLIGRDHQQLIAQDYNHGFPPSQWRAGDQVISWFDLRVPDNTPATVADVDFAIFNPETGQRLPVTQPNGAPAGDGIKVGPTRVDAPVMVAPPDHPFALRLGAHVLLDGYDLTPRPDGSLVLRLHWHADGPIDHDYTVFAHRLDRQGKFLVGADGEPASGHFPTSTWVPGEEVLDTHVLPPAADGTQVEVGMYLLATGQRLPVTDPATGKSGGDSIRVGD